MTPHGPGQPNNPVQPHVQGMGIVLTKWVTIKSELSAQWVSNFKINLKILLANFHQNVPIKIR